MLRPVSMFQSLTRKSPLHETIVFPRICIAYSHPLQFTHTCYYHKGEDIDHDRSAQACTEGYASWEEVEKRTAGLVARPRTLGWDPWENLWYTKQSVFWPFGKRVMELLILDKKERGAESQYYSGESGESRG